MRFGGKPMASYIYVCPTCKGYFLYAPSGLPASILDTIICPKCGHCLEMCRDQIKACKLPPTPVEKSDKIAGMC